MLLFCLRSYANHLTNCLADQDVCNRVFPLPSFQVKKTPQTIKNTCCVRLTCDYQRDPQCSVSLTGYQHLGRPAVVSSGRYRKSTKRLPLSAERFPPAELVLSAQLETLPGNFCAQISVIVSGRVCNFPSRPLAQGCLPHGLEGFL